jgi:hypothetical protein
VQAPETVSDLATALTKAGGVLPQAQGHGAPWLGSDRGVRYPVVAGIPLLTVDYAHDAYSSLGLTSGAVEAELDFYNEFSFKEAQNIRESGGWVAVERATRARGEFPIDTKAWIDSPYDGPAQMHCYEHLAPVVKNGYVCQVGGKGSHAVKLLLAGAVKAAIVTPVFAEAYVALACAREAGLQDRLLAVVGTGEAMPLATGSLDAIFCGGTLHHMETAAAAQTFSKVLKNGGRLGAMEPWRVPFLYAAGTRVLGKREREVFCRPIDAERLADFITGFQGTTETRRHGAITRYPLIALSKAGVKPDKDKLLTWMLRDDQYFRRIRSLGSSLSLVATKHG